MSTNLEYRAGERQRKRESRRQASEAQREKSKGDIFFVGSTTWKFCSGGDKIRNASGHQCKIKMSGSKEKKVNENTYDISSIKRVTKKFLQVSRCSRAKQRKRNVQKKSAARAKLLLLLIRPIVIFHCSPAFPSSLSITWFNICLNKLYVTNIIESFAFGPG